MIELRDDVAKGADDWRTWSAVERELQLVLECALDVMNMLLAWKGLARTERYRDAPRTLAEAGLLEDALADRLADAVSLRNVLVHGYAEVDHGRLRRVLDEDLEDLSRFAEAAAAACRRES